MSSNTEVFQTAFEKAKEVRLKAYTPYSKFKVGATFKIKDSDQYISGCNVENASFGATICAERNAVLSWIAQYGQQTELEYLVLVTETADAVPCGLCLQVLSEFFSPEFPIHIGDTESIKHHRKLKDFLPIPFEKKSLPKV